MDGWLMCRDRLGDYYFYSRPYFISVRNFHHEPPVQYELLKLPSMNTGNHASFQIASLKFLLFTCVFHTDCMDMELRDFG